MAKSMTPASTLVERLTGQFMASVVGMKTSAS
jgi:hypothetical protein